MKGNHVKARTSILLLVVGVVSILLSGGASVWALYNWEDSYNADFDFPANKVSIEKSWVELNGKSQIQSTQTKGNKKSKYTLYTKSRNASSYSTVYSNLSYKKNNTPSKIYKYTFGKWMNYKFKMKKTTQTGKHTTVLLMVQKK